MTRSRKTDKSIFKYIQNIFENVGIQKEKQYFLDSLSMMLGSGIGILTSLKALKEEVRSKRMKSVIESISKDIDSGSYLWKALKKTDLFPKYILSLIQVGEEAGKLPENLKIVALQQEKDRVFRSKLSSALLYPVLVFGVTIIIGLAVGWLVLPRLSSVFSSLNLDLPFLTQLVIKIGEIVNAYGIIIFPVFIIITAVTIFLLFVYPETKYLGERILSKLPGVKSLILQIELSRFGFILGTLLEVGIPIIQTLKSLEATTTSSRYKKFYSYLTKSIDEGKSFFESFHSYKGLNKIVPESIQQIIVSAEKSGNLAEVLKSIGSKYESMSESSTKNLIIILEPILLIVVWLGVVIIALAVIMPIYNLIGQL
jgi:type II secretory pathway component PulF